MDEKQKIVIPENTEEARLDDLDASKTHPIISRKSIVTLVILFTFTTLYGLLAGRFNLWPRTLVEGYIGATPLIFSSFIFVTIWALAVKTVVLTLPFVIIGY